MNIHKLKPTRNRVLLRKIEPLKDSQGSLLILHPETKRIEKLRSHWGEVVACGPVTVPFIDRIVLPTQLVVFNDMFGTEINEGDEQYKLMNLEDVLAVVEMKD